MTTPRPSTPLDAAMNARRKQLDMRWKDVADEAGLSEETIRIVRNDQRGTPIRTTDTEARIERALRWQRGSIQAIRNGGNPTPLPITGAPIGLTWTPRATTRKGNRYPDFVGTDPAYRAIWEIPDEVLPALERRYVITQIELLRWLRVGAKSM